MEMCSLAAMIAVNPSMKAGDGLACDAFRAAGKMMLFVCMLQTVT
jgi:hypothetical protein